MCVCVFLWARSIYSPWNISILQDKNRLGFIMQMHTKPYICMYVLPQAYCATCMCMYIYQLLVTTRHTVSMCVCWCLVLTNHSQKTPCTKCAFDQSWSCKIWVGSASHWRKAKIHETLIWHCHLFTGLYYYSTSSFHVMVGQEHCVHVDNFKQWQ